MSGLALSVASNNIRCVFQSCVRRDVGAVTVNDTVVALSAQCAMSSTDVQSRVNTQDGRVLTVMLMSTNAGYILISAATTPSVSTATGHILASVTTGTNA